MRLIPDVSSLSTHNERSTDEIEGKNEQGRSAAISIHLIWLVNTISPTQRSTHNNKSGQNEKGHIRSPITAIWNGFLVMSLWWTFSTNILFMMDWEKLWLSKELRGRSQEEWSPRDTAQGDWHRSSPVPPEISSRRQSERLVPWYNSQLHPRHTHWARYLHNEHHWHSCCWLFVFDCYSSHRKRHLHSWPAYCYENEM